MKLAPLSTASGMLEISAPRRNVGAGCVGSGLEASGCEVDGGDGSGSTDSEGVAGATGSSETAVEGTAGGCEPSPGGGETGEGAEVVSEESVAPG